jgi:hypothetical protein
MPIFSATIRHNRRGAIAVPISREQLRAHLRDSRPIVSRQGLKLRLTKAGCILAIGTNYFSTDRTWEK